MRSWPPNLTSLTRTSIDQIVLIFGLVLLILATGLRLSFLQFGLDWDELLTYWVSSSVNYSSVIDRAEHFQGQSPLYFLLIRFVCSWLLNWSEISLRAVSAVALLYCLFITWQLARLYTSASVAVVAVFCLLAQGDFMRNMLMARPYALAALTALISTQLLASCVQGPNRSKCVLYAVIFLSAMFFHYLTILLVPLHIAIAVRKKSKNLFSEQLVTVLVTTCIGLCLLFFKWRLISPNIKTYFGVGALPWRVALPALLPVEILFIIGASAFMSLLFIVKLKTSQSTHRTHHDAWLYFVFGWFIPIISMVLISSIIGGNFFAARYAQLFLPHCVIAIASFLTPIYAAIPYNFGILLTALSAVFFSFNDLEHTTVQWREALQLARSFEKTYQSSSIFFVPDVSESANLEWYIDPIKQSYLLSPTGYYQLLAVPLTLSPKLNQAEHVNYNLKILDSALLRNNQAWILIYGSYAEQLEYYKGYKYIKDQIDFRLYKLTKEKSFARIEVAVFEKISP